MTMKRESVVFNLADPDQKAMWEHVTKRTNISGYLKRLIQRDMEQGNVQFVQLPQLQPQIDEEEFDEEAIDQMLVGD